MWDTAQTNDVHLSHDMRCTRCGHDLHTFLACGPRLCLRTRRHARGVASGPPLLRRIAALLPGLARYASSRSSPVVAHAAK